MFVVGKELFGALRAARMFACEDETREGLNCVHLSAVGSALRVVATDGHTLWCCEIDARETAADQTPWNVALDDVDRIVRELKDAGEVEVEISIAKRECLGTTGKQRTEHFPPYQDVIPRPKPGGRPPEFALEYVARACEALRAYGKGLAPVVKKGRSRATFCSPDITWRVGDKPCDPAVFFSPKFPRALAIVMPRRGDDTAGVSLEAFIDRMLSKRAA